MDVISSLTPANFFFTDDKLRSRAFSCTLKSELSMSCWRIKESAERQYSGAFVTDMTNLATFLITAIPVPTSFSDDRLVPRFLGFLPHMCYVLTQLLSLTQKAQNGQQLQVLDIQLFCQGYHQILKITLFGYGSIDQNLTSIVVGCTHLNKRIGRFLFSLSRVLKMWRIAGRCSWWHGTALSHSTCDLPTVTKLLHAFSAMSPRFATL